MTDYTDFPVYPSFAHEDGNQQCPCNECSFARLKACDWCGNEYPIATMEPEEAGEWICRDCFERDLRNLNGLRRAPVIPESGGHIESADCWCGPTVEEDPGGTLIIHNQTH